VGLKYGLVSHCTSFVVVEQKDAVEEVERRDQGVVDSSPQSAQDDDEDWDPTIDAEHVCDDGNDDGMHRRSSGGKCLAFISNLIRSKNFVIQTILYAELRS